MQMVAPSFNVVHLNIQGRKNLTNVGTFIDKLIKRFQPAILFLTEVVPKLVEKNIPDGYNFHAGGTLRDHYEIEELSIYIPTVVVKIAGWRFVGL